MNKENRVILDQRQVGEQQAVRLEDRIDSLIDDWLVVFPNCIRASINDWKYNQPTIESIGEWPINVISNIHTLILTCPLIVALTSPSEYIREYRKAYDRDRDNRTTDL